MTPGIDDNNISKEDKEKALKEFEYKMSHSPIKTEKHSGLFTIKTWSGIEIDWTRILEFAMFAFVMVLVFGIADYVQINHNNKIMSNQDIIRQNQVLIINNQSKLSSNHIELLESMNHTEKELGVMLALLTVKMGEPCVKCHKDSPKCPPKKLHK
jgi:hypothetical protein